MQWLFTTSCSDQTTPVLRTTISQIGPSLRSAPLPYFVPLSPRRLNNAPKETNTEMSLNMIYDKKSGFFLSHW